MDRLGVYTVVTDESSLQRAHIAILFYVHANIILPTSKQLIYLSKLDDGKVSKLDTALRRLQIATAHTW